MSAFVPPEINVPKPGAVLVVGRDPGRDEVELGRPFVGRAGELLDAVLSETGLLREEINIANVVGYQPFENDFKNHSQERVEAGLAALHTLIRGLKPSLIITLGNEAAHAVIPGWPSSRTQGLTIFGAKGIEDRRGYFWDTPYGTVLAALHPAGVIRKQLPGRWLLETDFRRARRWLRGALPRDQFPPVRRLRSMEEVHRILSSKLVGWDIETKWDNTALLCFEPSQRTLKADGTWCAISDLTVGDRLIGFDEHPDHHGFRCQRVAVVESIEEDTGDLVELVTEHGSLCVTPDHRVLTKGKIKSSTWRQAGTLWVSKGKNTTHLARLFGPESFDSRVAGRLSAMVDGEGFISCPKAQRGGSLVVGAITQMPGEILERTKREIEQLGFTCAEHRKKSNGGASALSILGGSTEALRYLCATRPEKISKLLDFPALGRMSTFGSRLLGIVKRGRGKIIKVKTSTKTLVVEGFAVHNCSGYCGDDYQPYVATFPWEYETYGERILTSGVPLVTQNGYGFDVPAMRIFRGLHVKVPHDTQTMWWALEPDIAGSVEAGGEEIEVTEKRRMTRKGLAFLASIYFNLPWWKDYPDKDAPDHLEKMIQINSNDAFVQRWLASCMMAEIKEQDVGMQYSQAMTLHPVLMELHLRGLPVDETLRKTRHDALETRYKAARETSRAAGLSYIVPNDVAAFCTKRKCECCGGGKTQRDHCWRCGGLPKKPVKKADYSPDGVLGINKHQKVAALKAALPKCVVCNGLGKIKTYDFNPYSETQMKKFLFDTLNAPSSTFKGKVRSDAMALKKVLRWARNV